MNTQIAITRRNVLRGVPTLALMGTFAQRSPAQAQSISATEARTIAKDAYIYGFPLVDSYRIQYAYFVDRGNPEYKGPWNTIVSAARVFTPNDKAIQTPNSDTPYSTVGADLRSEPLVLTVPTMGDGRSTHCNSSTCTRSTLPRSAPAPPAMALGVFCLQAPAGMDRRLMASSL